MNSSQQIKAGAILSYLALGINVITGLVYTPWMISSIGRENYGLYTLAMSVITLFVFDFGLSAAVTRFLAKYLAERRQNMADKCLGLVYRLYLYIDIVLLIVLSVIYFFIPQIYQELSADEIEKFKVIYAIAAIFSVVSFPFIPVNGILTANEKFVQLKMCEIIHKLLIVVTMTICLLVGWGLYALVLVNALAGIINIILKWHCIKQYTSTKIRFGYYDKKQFGEIIGFSAWTTIISICSRFIFTLAPTILGIFVGSVPIAIFGIANTMESYVYSFSSAISGMFLPRVSQIVTKEHGNVMPLMIKIGRIQLMIVGSIVMGFICLGNHFIQLWVGGDFSESYICTVLLIIPSILQLPQEIGMQTIVARNEVKAQAIVWIIMAVVNIALSFLLAWKFGAVGICASICISLFVRTIGVDFIFKNRLHLALREFFKNTYIDIGLAIIIASVLSLFVNHYLPSVGIFPFVVKSILFVILYLLGMYLVTNKEEKDLVLFPIRSIIHRIRNR